MTLKSTSLMAALLAASLSSPVLAQEIDADADDQLEIEAEAEASARSAPPSSLRLDEVVVTAQKRAQDVRDVPIAMSVLSGQEMREQGITNFNDAAMLIPNVSINTDAYAMYIRGIGTAEANVLADMWALTVHVKNAADRLYKTFSSDVPITPGAHMAQSSKPRSISVQLEVSF